MVNVTRIIRFRAGEREYNFDGSTSIYVQDWQDNFGVSVPDTKRMGGADGGFDNYINQPFPMEIGSVRINARLAAETEPEMSALLDGIRQMRWWGKGRLYMQPADPSLPERWCFAKFMSLTTAHNYAKHTDLMMDVPIFFQASDPTWYSQGSFPFAWGDGTAWGDGSWGDTAIAHACSGLTTDFTLTRIGNAPVRARATVVTGVGQTAQNVTVQRLEGGVAVDEMKYTATLGASSTLDMNAWSMRVLLNTVDAYTTAFTTKRLDWFTLYPDVNTIRVKMNNVSDACTVTIKNYEAWV